MNIKSRLIKLESSKKGIGLFYPTPWAYFYGEMTREEADEWGRQNAREKPGTLADFYRTKPDEQ